MEYNKGDALEIILDHALHAYSQAEPLAGLEERILNRTRAAKVERDAGYARPFATASLALLLCLSAFVLLRPGHTPGPKISPVAANRKPTVPRLHLAVQPHLAARSRRRPRVLPKQEQFPTPEPLSAEERILARFVDRDPNEAAKSFASLRNVDAPIAIPPLQITPLQADGVSN
ncbi:MAG: hypothetical protein WB992_10545 [Bryobacteraceae bacterium]